MPSDANDPATTAERSLLAIYALLAFALLSLVGAALGIYGGLNKLATASYEVEKSYQRIGAINDILSIARDSETAQRGYLLTGQESFLDPYRLAQSDAPLVWQNLAALTTNGQANEVANMLCTYYELVQMNDHAIALRRAKGPNAPELAMEVRTGKAKMDQLRAEVSRFIRREQDHLRKLRREDDIAYNDAIVQTLIGSFALIVAGALLYAAVREARQDAGKNAALAEAAEQRFRATFEQASIGILHLSPDGTPIIVNDALCRMTGYTRSEILAAIPRDPAYAALLLDQPDTQQALTKGAARHVYAIHAVTRKDGTILWLASLLSAVRKSDGEIAFWSMMLRDVSEQHEAEQNLLDSQDRLRRLQDEMAHIGRVNDLGEMAAAIAHEINQPLTAISNYMSVAQHMAGHEAEGASELGEILGRAGEQAVRAGQIIRRMRSFIERREQVRTAEPIDELIESAIDLALLGADRTRVDITYTRDAPNVRLWVDPVQIQQIILILLRNAIEAFDRGGRGGRADIHIRTEIEQPDGNHIAIHVQDNGPGLSPNIQAELFQPFVTTKLGNMGMGLPIARRLAEQHGGRLESVPSDQGAHFVIHLPLPDQQATEA